ncbi:hypothetical protein B0H11DRAFT_2251520 [Mycena galericulata]|nr:hypothetical protein B0H11DRAFT_2251520 [Mycena galericulata]
MAHFLILIRIRCLHILISTSASSSSFATALLRPVRTSDSDTGRYNYRAWCAAAHSCLWFLETTLGPQQAGVRLPAPELNGVFEIIFIDIHGTQVLPSPHIVGRTRTFSDPGVVC